VTGQSQPELALLLAIARVGLTESEKRHLNELLAAGPDWQRLLALAEMHGLEALLFIHLKQNAAGMVPAAVMESLRETSNRIAGRNLILAKRLEAVSAHLRARGIEHAAFKGPLLAEVYYGNCALRFTHDLDLVVPAHCAAAARDALSEMGFRDQFGLDEAQQALVFRFNYEHGFKAADGVLVDLHWGLAPKLSARKIDMAGLWRRVRLAKLMDGEVPMFGAEDLLFSLALHAGNDNHAWSQFSQFCDMAEVLRAHPKFDWAIVEIHLGGENIRRSVYVSLYILEKHWQAGIPEEMFAKICSDPEVARLADRVEAEWWPMPTQVETKPTLEWLLARSRGESMVNRARLLIGQALTPTRNDFHAVKLPGALEWLYPVVRLARIVGGSAARAV